jgi:hypothetical protein
MAEYILHFYNATFKYKTHKMALGYKIFFNNTN